MIRRLLFLFITFVSVALLLAADAFAQPMVAVGGGLVLEQEGRSKKLETRVPLVLRGGWSFSEFDGFVEYQTFGTTDGEGYVSVHRRHHGWLGFARLKLPPVNEKLIPFLGAGAGLHFESVRTKIAAQSVETDGSLRASAAIATGVMLTNARGFDVSLDLRLVTSDGFQPNPTFGATLALGARF
ncbi:MAG: hypothetical protein NDI61_12200 [Bdellovibrionaceae bacterium]|nr:hypothetical protein [Pseudobdellovibrionaceae bacterium]